LAQPLAEAMGWLRNSVGELIRQSCLQVKGATMEGEVRSLAGQGSPPWAERKTTRWDQEHGYWR
jgi:hypothetical protein